MHHHRGHPLHKPGPSEPETLQGGQQRPQDLLTPPGPGQSSMPSKDKRRQGFALWERPSWPRCGRICGKWW